MSLNGYSRILLTMCLFSGVAAAAPVDFKKADYERCRGCSGVISGYDSADLIDIPEGSDLSAEVAKHAGKKLFRVQGGGDYPLSRPLVLGKGQTIIPDKISDDNFIQLRRGDGFAFDDAAQVASLVTLFDNSNLIGVSLDVESFFQGAQLSDTATKAGIYTKSAAFNIFWLDMKASGGVDYGIWSDTANLNPEAQNISQHISQSYIESSNVSASIFIDQPEGLYEKDTYSLKRLIITLGGESSHRDKQVGVWVNNGKGEFEHADVLLKKVRSSGSVGKREYMHLMQTFLLSKENLFDSEETELREEDVVLDSIGSAHANHEIYMKFNRITDQATYIEKDGLISGEEFDNYAGPTMWRVPTQEEFFKRGSEPGQQGPNAGTLVVDYNSVSNVIVAANETGVSDWSSIYGDKKWSGADSFRPPQNNRLIDTGVSSGGCSQCEYTGYQAWGGTMTVATVLSVIYGALQARKNGYNPL